MSQLRAATALSILIALSGCRPRSNNAADAGPPPKNPLPINLETRTQAICDRLVAAHAASSCGALRGSAKAGFTLMSFQPVGIPPAGKQGSATIRVFFEGSTAHSESTVFAAQPADDFPGRAFYAFYATDWGDWEVTGTNDAWLTCREKQPVAACAKQLPAIYASFKKVQEAAKQIFDDSK